MVWGLVSLSALPQGSVRNDNPLQIGTQTTVPCAQVENSGMLGPLQFPNWAKVCLVSTFFFLPVSIVPRVEKCLGISVGDRVLYLRSMAADFCKSFYCFVSCQSHMSRHPLEGYWKLSCQLDKRRVQAPRNRKGSGITIWVSDVDSAAAIFHPPPQQTRQCRPESRHCEGICRQSGQG